MDLTIFCFASTFCAAKQKTSRWLSSAKRDRSLNFILASFSPGVQFKSCGFWLHRYSLKQLQMFKVLL